MRASSRDWTNYMKKGSAHPATRVPKTTLRWTSPFQSQSCAVLSATSAFWPSRAKCNSPCAMRSLRSSSQD
jgi:hypothetical protein